MSYCEWPEFYNETFPKARKPHRCVECAAPIEIGEEHLYYRGKWDGEFSADRQHMLCREVCMFLNREHRDECFPFGGLWEFWADIGFSDNNWLRKHASKENLEQAKTARSLIARVKVRHRKHRSYRKRIDGIIMRRKWGQTWQPVEVRS